MSYRIAIANEKGGVAKTTTALSLGAALAEHGRPVLLVDLDPQANLTMSLGFKPDRLEHTIADLLMGDGTLKQAILQTDIEGISLVPASQQLLMTEQFLRVRQDFESILKGHLADDQDYSYMLLDCPPTLGVTTRSALVAADLLIIPTQAEFYSASALHNVLDLIREIRSGANPDLRYRLLLTMLDRRNRIHRTLFEQIRKTFGQAVFTTVIEVDTRLRESPIFGRPITAYAPSSRGAEQYRALGEELMEYATQANR
jgi:chromosome partitioning protein